MAKKTTESDELKDLIRQTVKSIVDDKDAKPEHKLRALELACKLLAIQAKLDSGEDDDSFFGK